MMLRPRVAATGLLLSIPAALVTTWWLSRVRERDLSVALTRVVESQVNDQVRERCESDPNWFFTGPLDGRPRAGEKVDPDNPPRPRHREQPFELFAYDDQFLGSSSAAPRFPVEIRNALRTLVPEAQSEYASGAGTGLQIGMSTGWVTGPCAYLLGRLQPPPDHRSALIWGFFGVFGLTMAVALVTSTHTIWRIRRLAGAVKESIRGGFGPIATERRKDELGTVAFAYNDLVTELKLRRNRADDLDAALRRSIATTEDDIGQPLAALERALSASDASTEAAAERTYRHAHDLSGEVDNLIAAARLKLGPSAIVATSVDLNALVTRVVAREEPFARQSSVALQTRIPTNAISARADEALLERAVANLVDNAIRYNRPGGHVVVSLAQGEGQQPVRIWVADDGPGVSDETFKGLTAVRRFRGDENRNRRPDAPGLGLTISREVADRFGMVLELRRPGGGGFEAEIRGRA